MPALFQVHHFINDPTSAAITFDLNEESDEERYIFIFNLGGSTFDVSLLDIDSSILKVCTLLVEKILITASLSILPIVPIRNFIVISANYHAMLELSEQLTWEGVNIFTAAIPFFI